MNIGYACLTIGIPNTALRSCTLKYATEQNLYDIIADNLKALDHILDYNITNQIKLFRISSDLIPFGSSPANKLEWWSLFEDKFISLGNKITEHGIRVSMHPGQYTVLNSPNEEVVEKAIRDLKYHNRVLDSLGVDKKHKMVLHIGGIYNNKEQAMYRFIENYNKLDKGIKDRLVLENDDKLYNIKDVMQISSIVHAPIIFDNLHHKMNPCEGEQDEFYWIEEADRTWNKEDGVQKIHYSQQHPRKKPGSHSDTITADLFESFCKDLNRDDIDIMLEVKDKNLSAVKCNNAVSSYPSMKNLEQEWSRYKYAVLERDPGDYQTIRQLLKQKDRYPVLEFYTVIDQALQKDISTGNGINAAQHVWGYFKDLATEKEKKLFESRLSGYQGGKSSLSSVKKCLWQLTNRYQQSYLLASYYFAEVID